MFTMAFYYIYLSVTRRALDVFNCNPSIPSDGYMYTEFTSVACEGGLCKCDEPGTGMLIGCFKRYPMGYACKHGYVNRLF